MDITDIVLGERTTYAQVEQGLVLALVKEISEEVRAEIKRAVAEAIREELKNDDRHLSRL